jgi:hypothetical protein
MHTWIDAQSIDKILKLAHGEAHTYVKNKLRKEKPMAHANTLWMQNRYISNVKTIILVRITSITMADLRPLLLGKEHITYVAATTKLDTIGRWVVLTDDIHRTEAIQTITTKLTETLTLKVS